MWWPGSARCRRRSTRPPDGRWDCAPEALTDRLVAHAFDAGEILRTHAMRPTWHFVAPADIRWLQMLTGPRVQALNAYYARKNELDGKTIARSRTVIERALAGGHQRTRTELAAVAGKGGHPCRRPAARLPDDERRARPGDLQRSATRQAVHVRAARGTGAKGAAAAARRGAGGADAPVLHQSRAGNAARLRLVVRPDDGGCQARGGDRRTRAGAGDVRDAHVLVGRVRPGVHPPEPGGGGPPRRTCCRSTTSTSSRTRTGVR